MRPLSEVLAQIRGLDLQGAWDVLRAWYGAAQDAGRDVHIRAVVDITGVLRELSPALGGRLAVVGGAFVEGGADPEPLGRALIPLLERDLVAAARLIEHGEDEPHEDDGEDDDEDDDGEGEDEGGEVIGDRWFSAALLGGLAEEHPGEVAALEALDDWSRAAAAAWTRAPWVLQEAQRDPGLRQAVLRMIWTDRLQRLTYLMGVPFDAPFVVLVPALGSGWTFRVSGCTDIGQLSMLISEPLADAITRIGAEGRASDEVLAVARGDGPQSSDLHFAASFHLYPWQAADPETLVPRDGAFTWVAPGGEGTHSLPADFLAGDVEPLEGARVLLLVGPLFTRITPATRYFSGLAARLDDVGELSPAEVQRWHDVVRRALRAQGE